MTRFVGVPNYSMHNPTRNYLDCMKDCGLVGDERLLPPKCHDEEKVDSGRTCAHIPGMTGPMLHFVAVLYCPPLRLADQWSYPIKVSKSKQAKIDFVTSTVHSADNMNC